MKSAKALLGFSLFAVVAVALTFTIWSTLQRSVDGDTHRYSAVFSDVLGLRVGDDVRMAGVRVGRVDEIISPTATAPGSISGSTNGSG
ncbi:MlaD family protein [Nocardia asiatica]|uniref:MlaD family protein n=1 Tax=Nocardia asiatica TaxID=209252 RepID=UPI003EE3325C